MSDCMTVTLEFPTFALGLVAVQEALHREGSPNQEIPHPDDTTTLVWEELPWGEARDVEETLKTLGIAFDRHSDAKYEYNAESRMFRPATDGVPMQDVTVYAISNRQVVATLVDLAEWAKAGPLTIEAIRSHMGLPSETVVEWASKHDAATFVPNPDGVPL